MVRGSSRAPLPQLIRSVTHPVTIFHASLLPPPPPHPRSQITVPTKYLHLTFASGSVFRGTS